MRNIYNTAFAVAVAVAVEVGGFKQNNLQKHS